MWEPHPSVDFERRLKKYSKRHRQETLNALANLATYLEGLRAGLTPQKLIRGWVHAEPKGIKAIDETGPKNPRKAIRLYVYPEEDRELLHVLLIGDKDTQSDDIKQCSVFVDNLLANSRDKQSENSKESETYDQASQQAAG